MGGPPLCGPENPSAPAIDRVSLERPLDAMGRPKKAALASRANGATAKNKGKAVDVKKELFGGYSPGGVVK